MIRFITLLTLALMLGLVPVTTATAQDAPAIVTIIHGIPGEDLGLDPDLPVDVFVAEVGCALTDFRFGDVSTRLELPAGRYTVEIRLADEAAGDCGGATAIGPASIPFDSGENASVIAHLTEDGGLTASKYTNNVMPAGDEDLARVAVHHDAAVGAVDIRLYSVYGRYRFKPAVELKGVVNPESADTDVPAGVYLAAISTPSRRPIAYRFVSLRAGESTLLYAVGSRAAKTFDLLADVQTLEVPEPGEEPATLTVIHGLPGTDLGLDPELSVDVYVAELDACVLQDFRFGDISPRLTLPADTYTVEVRLADIDAGPCGGATAIGPAPIELEADENATVIAHLTELGAPTASKFTNDLSKTARGKRSRISVHHVAAAPAVDISLSRRIWFWTLRFLKLEDVTNGAQASVDVSGNARYTVSIAPAGGIDIFREALRVSAGENALAYAVGSVESGTFQLIIDRQDLD